MLIDGLELRRLLFDYCFFRCLNSHSNSIHSLQRIHWWKSALMYVVTPFIQTNLGKKIYIYTCINL